MEAAGCEQRWQRRRWTVCGSGGGQQQAYFKVALHVCVKAKILFSFVFLSVFIIIPILNFQIGIIIGIIMNTYENDKK